MVRAPLRVRQMRETVHGEQALRAEGARLLRDALPPALRESLLRMQPGQAWEKMPSCAELSMDIDFIGSIET